MAESLMVRALMTRQGQKTPLYSFFLPGKDLLKIADISRIQKSSDGNLLGYQRGEVLRHVNEIAEYLNSGDVIFPNAIILAMSSEAQFRKSRGPQIGSSECLAGTLEIPLMASGSRPAWIVDGQQRTLAITKSSKKDLMVPVTAFISNDFEVHRTQFLLVNKVKPLPSGLINELLPAVNTVLPPSLAKNKIPSAICNMLNKDPKSPFNGLIIRQTTDLKKNKNAVIADNSLLQVIRSSLNSVHGCLYQYKNVATGEIDVDSILKSINLYWLEVKRLFPDAWGMPPIRSRLMHGVGIKSMGVLMDRVMCNVHPDDKSASVKIQNCLNPLKRRCAWTSGSWEQLGSIPWNHLQNTPSHVKLLSNALIRAYTGAGKK